MACRSVAYFDLTDASAAGVDPKGLIEVAGEVGADVIGLRAAGISAWYRTAIQHHPSALPDGAPDFLRELIARAKGENFRVVAGVDFGVAGEMTLRLRPEWFVRDDLGHTRELDNGQYRICPLAPYRAEAVAIPVMEELAEYGPDGVIIHNTEIPMCRCGACHLKFQQLAGADLPASGDEGSPLFSEWRHWLNTVTAGRIAAQIQALGADGQRPVVVVEMMGLAAPGEANTMTNSVDSYRQGDGLLVRNPGGTNGATPAAWVNGVRTRHGLAFSPEHAVWVEMPEAKPGEGGMREIMASGISVLAAGGTLWNRFSRLVESDDPVLPVLARLAEHGKMIRNQLGDAVDDAPVTIVWPDGAGNGDVPQAAREEFFGFANAFVNHGVSFAVLPGHLLEIDRLERYRAVVLPSATNLSDRQMQTIRRFVRAGGGLLASFTSGMNDAAGNPRRPWDLAGMVNAAFEGHILELGRDYVAVPADSGWLKTNLPSNFGIPAEHRLVVLRAPEGSDALMELEYRGEVGGQDTGIPFFLGSIDHKVLYWSGEIGRIVWEGNTAGAGRLLANAVRRAIGGEFEVDLRASRNVEMHISRAGARVFAYLQNRGDCGPNESDVAVGISFKEDARPQEANLIKAGRPARLELADGCAWAIVPELQGWELVEFVFPD